MADKLNVQLIHPLLGAIGGRIIDGAAFPGGEKAAKKFVADRRGVWTMQVPTEGLTVFMDGDELKALDAEEKKQWDESKAVRTEHTPPHGG